MCAASESPVLSTSRDLLSWWLAAAGVRLLGDHPSSCEAPELMIDDVLPRSDFSEVCGTKYIVYETMYTITMS